MNAPKPSTTPAQRAEAGTVALPAALAPRAEGPRIYNLFPLLVGRVSAWTAELPRIARERAGAAFGDGDPFPRDQTIVIGDTPRDIACARADEVRVAAVATGPFAVEALADADAVVDDAYALLPVLEDWI